MEVRIELTIYWFNKRTRFAVIQNFVSLFDFSRTTMAEIWSWKLCACFYWRLVLQYYDVCIQQKFLYCRNVKHLGNWQCSRRYKCFWKCYFASISISIGICLLTSVEECCKCQTPNWRVSKIGKPVQLSITGTWDKWQLFFNIYNQYGI